MRDDVVYALMEVRQETDYVLHDAQKILAIDDPANRQGIPANLDTLLAEHRAGAFEYQAPDEWRLDAQLADYARGLAISARMVDSAHFYTSRDAAAALFKGKKQWLMERFYRAMRVKHGVLAADGDRQFFAAGGLDPQAVHRWYLGVYIDAFEWVELPNTLGMSQFADGGLLATKPYVSSAASVDRMSDYCRGCAYDRKQRTGDTACPFNALYWDSFDRHAGTLGRNPRLGMVYRQLAKLDMAPVRARASPLRSRLDAL